MSIPPPSRAYRHIVLFRLRPEADPAEAISRLRALGGEPHVREWRVEESLDTRKGRVLAQVGRFDCAEDFQAFRQSALHREVAGYLAGVADWWVADYLE